MWTHEVLRRASHVAVGARSGRAFGMSIYAKMKRSG